MAANHVSIEFAFCPTLREAATEQVDAPATCFPLVLPQSVPELMQETVRGENKMPSGWLESGQANQPGNTARQDSL